MYSVSRVSLLQMQCLLKLIKRNKQTIDFKGIVVIQVMLIEIARFHSLKFKLLNYGSSEL